MEKNYMLRKLIHNGIRLFREAAEDRTQERNVLDILRQNNF